MRRAGFTLIEILIVVGIIVIMLATAVMSVTSGRGAVQVKEATRGVIQLSRYASALALLRQRPVVITFHHKGKIEVRISGEATDSGEKGTPADPIYREVAGFSTLTAAEYSAADDDEESPEAGKTQKDGAGQGGEAASGGGGKGADEKKGLFFTRRVLDPEVLAKEDAEGEYESVTFSVEVLGEDGEPLDRDLAASLSLQQPKREKKDEDGEIIEDDQEVGDAEPPMSITYEPNGKVTPHRITVRLEGESEAAEGFVINVSSSGKATVGDEEEEGRRSRAKRRRRR